MTDLEKRAEMVLAESHRAIEAADRLLEIAHVAHRLSVSLDTARRYIREGYLVAIRLPKGHLRVRESVLRAFIDSRETAANACNTRTPR